MKLLILQCLFCALTALHAVGQTSASAIDVTIDPPRFGDVSSILKVDSTVGSFKFNEAVSRLELVLEAYPKEARMVPVGRLALELTSPVKEGRFCVQMADQGFLPLGNGAPHQMQLFMQLDCGGTNISSSQSFLKEKFNFSRSLARSGAGTNTREMVGTRVPLFWLMGNSESGTYFHQDNIEKMIAKNGNAYVLIAYLNTAKEGQTSTLAAPSQSSSKSTIASDAAPTPSSASGASVAVVQSPAKGSEGASTSKTQTASTAKGSSGSRPKLSSASSAKKKTKRNS